MLPMLKNDHFVSFMLIPLFMYRLDPSLDHVLATAKELKYRDSLIVSLIIS